MIPQTSKQTPSANTANYRAISVLDQHSSQMTGAAINNIGAAPPTSFLNMTQLLTNRHSSLGGTVQQIGQSGNRKSSPGKKFEFQI